MDLAAIKEKLKDPSEDVRIKGCVDLSESGHPKASSVLRQVLDRESSPRVRYAIRKLLDLVESKKRSAETGLGPSPPPPAAPQVPATEAVETAGKPVEQPTEEEQRLRQIVGELSSPDFQVRLGAAISIGREKDPRLLDHVLAALDSENNAIVVASLVKAVGSLGDHTHVSRLGPFLRDKNPRVRANAVEAMLGMQSPLSLALVFPLLQDPDHRVRANASKALSIQGERTALTVLQKMVESDQLWMRDSAAFALGELHDPAAVPLLISLHADRNVSVREKAEQGLRKFAEAGFEDARRFIEGLSYEEHLPETAVEIAEVLKDEQPGLPTLQDPNPKLRMNVVNEIIANKDSEGLSTLIDHLYQEENVFVTSRIISGIGLLGVTDPSRYRSVLQQYLNHHDLRTVANTIEAATRLQDTSFRERIKLFLNHPNPRIRSNALYYLSNDPSVDVAKKINEMVLHTDVNMQRASIFLVERLATQPDLISQLTLLSGTKDGDLYFCLCEALERMAAKGVIQARRMLHSLKGNEDVQGVQRPQIRLEKPAYMKRMTALITDILLALIAGLLLGFIVAIITGVTTGGNQRAAVSNVMIIRFICCIIFFIRDGLFGGRGIGKRWVGLRIIDISTGEGCSFFRSLLRQATLGLPLVNLAELVLPAFDPRGQRLIDKLLDTQVIDEKKKELTTFQTVLAIVGMIIIVILGVLMVIGYMAQKGQLAM